MPIYKVQKRNGGIVDFDLSKIEQAIAKAALAVGKEEDVTAHVLAQEVYVKLEEQFEDGIPSVEQTQDLVEETGQLTVGSAGRPAKLFRFRSDVLLERAISGSKLPLAKGIDGSP